MAKPRLTRRDFEVPEGLDSYRDNVAVFWSGVGKSKADFNGVMRAGEFPGITAAYDEKGSKGRYLKYENITKFKPQYVEYFRRKVGPMFIDSGAYIAGSRGWVLDWDRVFDAYHAFAILAAERGQDIVVVAPDIVGDQRQTLREWRATAKEVKALLRRKNVYVVVPLQRNGNFDGRGKFTPAPGKPLAYMWSQAKQIFGNRISAGLPMKQNDLDDALAFMRKANARHVHLLGQGWTRDLMPFLPGLSKAVEQLSIDAIATGGSFGGGGDQVPRPSSVKKLKGVDVRKTQSIADEMDWLLANQDKMEDLYQAMVHDLYNGEITPEDAQQFAKLMEWDAATTRSFLAAYDAEDLPEWWDTEGALDMQALEAWGAPMRAGIIIWYGVTPSDRMAAVEFNLRMRRQLIRWSQG